MKWVEVDDELYVNLENITIARLRQESPHKVKGDKIPWYFDFWENNGVVQSRYFKTKEQAIGWFKSKLSSV